MLVKTVTSLSVDSGSGWNTSGEAQVRQREYTEATNVSQVSRGSNRVTYNAGPWEPRVAAW